MSYQALFSLKKFKMSSAVVTGTLRSNEGKNPPEHCGYQRALAMSFTASLTLYAWIHLQEKSLKAEKFAVPYYHIRPNYRTCSYKCTVKQLRSL